MSNRLARVGALAALVVLAAACGGTGPSASTASSTAPPPSASVEASPSASAAAERFTAAEVTAATGGHQVVPIYEVPKTLKERYKMAFLNPGKTVPFFVDWSDGMKAASTFYGVDFIETDLNLKFEDTVSSYETIAVQEPDVLGTLTTAGVALKAQTDKVGLPIIPIDIAIPGNPYFLGIPNDKAGQFAGAFIAKAAAAKIAGDWAGRTVTYIGLGSDNADVQKRVTSALDEIRKTVTIEDANVVYLLCNGQADPCQTATTDTLTARPNDVILIVAMNDEAGVGALQAVKSQNRTADVIMVTQGADKAGLDMIRGDTTGVMLGAVDYNPWAEGWSWIEAAIAVAEGEEFRPYDVNRVITPDNIDEAYPATP